MFFFKFFFTFFIFCITFSFSQEELFLRDNFKKAQVGDYLVTIQSKTYTLLLIQDKTEEDLVIEELSIPEGKFPLKEFSWRQWMEAGAPQHTFRIRYKIDIVTGKIKNSMSLMKGKDTFSGNDNLLTRLLNLHFHKIPLHERKRVGNPTAIQEQQNLWQPRLIVEGKVIPKAYFEAWRAKWPKDGSELSGRTIEIYLPEESEKYPSYFPYWLQVSGGIAKARMRVVDSGSQMISHSLHPLSQDLKENK